MYHVFVCFHASNPRDYTLVGGWTNPFEKYARQIGFHFPNFRGEHKKYLSCHQETVPFYLPPPTLISLKTPLVPNIPAASEEGFEDVAGITSITAVQAFFTSVGLAFIVAVGYQIPLGCWKNQGVLRLNPPETWKKKAILDRFILMHLYIPLKVWTHFLHFEHKVMEVDGSDDVPFQLGDF